MLVPSWQNYSSFFILSNFDVLLYFLVAWHDYWLPRCFEVITRFRFTVTADGWKEKDKFNSSINLMSYTAFLNYHTEATLTVSTSSHMSKSSYTHNESIIHNFGWHWRPYRRSSYNLFFKPELSLLQLCVHFPPLHWVTHSLTLLHGFLLTWPFVRSAIIHFLSTKYCIHCWSCSKKQGIQNSCSNILVEFPTRK